MSGPVVARESNRGETTKFSSLIETCKLSQQRDVVPRKAVIMDPEAQVILVRRC